MSSDLPLLDDQQLQQLLQYTSADFLGRLFDAFEQAMPAQIAQLAACLDAPAMDVACRTRLAHAIKSSAGNIGAQRLAAVAARIEAAPSAARIEADLCELQDVYTQSLAALRRRLPTVPPHP